MRTLLADEFLDHADRQMRLAHSCRADKQQSSLFFGILLDETPSKESGIPDALLFLVIRIAVEGAELAMLVMRGNMRRRQQAVGAAFLAAIAAHRFALFAALDGLPSGAAADGTCLGRGGHEFESTAERGRRAIQLSCRFAPIRQKSARISG